MTDRFVTVPDSLELPPAVKVPVARLVGPTGAAATPADLDAATAAQGALADVAVQPGDLGNAAGLDVGATAGTVMAGDDSRVTSLPSTYGRLCPGLVPLNETLATATSSCAVQVLGDSTGNDVTEWVYLLAQDLAADYPAWTVDHRVWDDATQQYAAATRIQTGTAGDRFLDLSTGTTGRRMVAGGVPHMTGTMDLRVKIYAADWSPETQIDLLVHEEGAGKRSWFFWLGSNGRLHFTYSTDGTALTTVYPGPFALTLTPETTAWLRVVFTPDDGAGNLVHAFYTSPDGITWTQIGTTGTVVGAVTVFDAKTAPHFIGSRVSAAAGTPDARIYEVQIRDGLNGPLIAPALPDLWAHYGAPADMDVVGAPILTFVNGSRSGANIAYLGDATRLPKLVPDYGQVLVFLSDSHNEVRNVGRPWVSPYSACLAAAQALAPLAPIVVLTQNPENGAINQVAHARRRRDLLTWARAAKVDIIDTFGAFEADGRPIADLLADAVHPNAAGSALWAATIRAALDSAV